MRKVLMAAGVVSMSVGLITSLSIDARSNVTGSGEKGPSQISDCGGIGTGDAVICMNENSNVCTPRHCH